LIVLRLGLNLFSLHHPDCTSSGLPVQYGVVPFFFPLPIFLAFPSPPIFPHSRSLFLILTQFALRFLIVVRPSFSPLWRSFRLPPPPFLWGLKTGIPWRFFSSSLLVHPGLDPFYLSPFPKGYVGPGNDLPLALLWLSGISTNHGLPPVENPSFFSPLFLMHPPFPLWYRSLASSGDLSVSQTFSLSQPHGCQFFDPPYLG